MAAPYNHHEVEQKWQKIWDDEQAFKVSEDYSKPKYYALVEFPYPSGAGLHVGHPRPYTALDIVARKRRMLGILRLLGFTRPSLLCYPLIQTAATALAGFCLSCLVYLAVAQVIGHAFSQQGLSCHLSPCELLGAAVACCSLALLAGLAPALTAACAEPSAAIRGE